MGEGGGPISNSYATGSVTATAAAPMAYVGGLAGLNYASISHSYATGSVTRRLRMLMWEAWWAILPPPLQIPMPPVLSLATDAETLVPSAGGLVGYNTGTISSSYATGAVAAGNGGPSRAVSQVTATPRLAVPMRLAKSPLVIPSVLTITYAGGLVGYADIGSTISGSYATGAVSGGTTATLGGLAGLSAAAIDTSYALGLSYVHDILQHRRASREFVRQYICLLRHGRRHGRSGYRCRRPGGRRDWRIHF